MVSSNFLTGAALLALASTAAAASSPCPYNYPPVLNSTGSDKGLIFTVVSSNPQTNNRAVQLRPNPFLAGAFFGGVDDKSAVLLGNLVDAGLYAQGRDAYNQVHDLGPTAYLSERREVNGTTQYSFAFANATQWPGAVEQGFRLLGGPSDGAYGLYHEEGVGVANGFMLCEADVDLDNGGWFQLFYYTYAQTSADIPGCESVGVRTTVAASILNGACDIGGVVATD